MGSRPHHISATATEANRVIVSDVADRSAEDVLRLALATHEALALSFSGAEDVVLIELLKQVDAQALREVRVFCLDTGRLHKETYEFLERVRSHYGIDLHVIMPNSDLVGDLVRRKGLFSFYEDGHNECCSVRKIEPLSRILSAADAWITGQRRDQSVTRTQVDQIHEDAAFRGRGGSLTKYNPIAGWSSVDVWAFIRSHQVPFNSLHERGFVSIGCEPCTRAIGPHEHERAGRWWWEDATMKECGLHVAPAVTASHNKGKSP